MSDMLHNECTMWNCFSYSKIKNSKSGENKEHRDMLKKRFSDFSNVSGKIIWHLIKSAYHLVLFSALVMQEFTEYENLCLLSHSANLIPVKKGKINLTSWLVFMKILYYCHKCFCCPNFILLIPFFFFKQFVESNKQLQLWIFIHYKFIVNVKKISTVYFLLCLTLFFSFKRIFRKN